MPRTERLYLTDIVDAAAEIARDIADRSHEGFLADRVLQRAVLQSLTVIGEAASHLSRPLRARYPDIVWSDIVAFRNIAVHAYFAVDWDIVWEAASRNAPELRQRVAEILNLEYPGEADAPDATP